MANIGVKNVSEPLATVAKSDTLGANVAVPATPLVDLKVTVSPTKLPAPPSAAVAVAVAMSLASSGEVLAPTGCATSTPTMTMSVASATLQGCSRPHRRVPT
ncbi:MAG: hypothetical protein ACYCPT_00585 [Acidimicrobiales bacterium]